jgi:hypothetical protein
MTRSSRHHPRRACRREGARVAVAGFRQAVAKPCWHHTLAQAKAGLERARLVAPPPRHERDDGATGEQPSPAAALLAAHWGNVAARYGMPTAVAEQVSAVADGCRFTPGAVAPPRWLLSRPISSAPLAAALMSLCLPAARRCVRRLLLRSSAAGDCRSRIACEGSTVTARGATRAVSTRGRPGRCNSPPPATRRLRLDRCDRLARGGQDDRFRVG